MMNKGFMGIIFPVLFRLSTSVSRRYTAKIDLNDNILQENLLSEYEAYSLIMCSAMCGPGCTFFGFNFQRQKCRLHAGCHSTNSAGPEVGWRYFIPDTEGPKDCYELYTFGNTRSGVYTIYPWDDIKRSISVYCEMGVSPGGMSVFQRRGIDKSVLFNRTWHEYKYGFGNLSTDFWLGNEVIHQLTAIDSNKLYIELKDTSLRSFHARYESFSIGPETDEYRLHVAGNFSGNVTHDYVTRGSYILNGQPFVTPDRPDQAQCASRLDGGWWFNACENVYLNGPFNTDYWVWKGSVDEYHYLEYTAMIITRG